MRAMQLERCFLRRSHSSNKTLPRPLPSPSPPSLHRNTPCVSRLTPVKSQYPCCLVLFSTSRPTQFLGRAAVTGHDRQGPGPSDPGKCSASSQQRCDEQQRCAVPWACGRWIARSPRPRRSAGAQGKGVSDALGMPACSAEVLLRKRRQRLELGMGKGWARGSRKISRVPARAPGLQP